MMRIIFSLILVSFFGVGFVHAAESTSNSFEIHGSAIDSIASGTTTSSSYALSQAGGQLSTGQSSSASYSIQSGILYLIYGIFVPQYNQIHYRWRNDDGSETAATWAAAQDATLLNLSTYTAKRLRIAISNEGWTRGGPQQFQIEFARLTSGSDCANGPFSVSYTAVPTNYTNEWHLSTSTQVTDGTTTTNQLTAENNSFNPGEIKTTSNTTGNILLTSKDFTEIEYGLSGTGNAVNGATYCFRVTDVGSTTNYAYSQYAKVTLGNAYPATGFVISPTFDTYTVNGAHYNWIKWVGSLNGGLVRLQLGTSNTSNGPFTYVGSDCTAGTYFEPASDTSVDVACSSTHNNMRYFRYKVTLCSSSDCSSTGSNTPQVDDVVVNWSP